MLELGRIMVPVDFSQASQVAVRYGVSLAVEFDATLLLAHVVPFLRPIAYAYPFESVENRTTLAEEIRGKLESVVDEEFRNAVHKRFAVSTGDVNDEILGIVAEEKPDLIVLGSHGRRAFERWFLGSVSGYIVRRSPVPVLTVAHLDEKHRVDEPKPIPLRKIVYATDLSDSSGRALEMAFELTHKFSAELVVLHVMKPIEWAYGAESLPLDIEETTDRVLAGLSQRLDESIPERIHADPRIRTELVVGNPTDHILRVAAEEDADMIVLNTQSKSALERAFLGSTAEGIVRRSSVPVLSVPPPRKKDEFESSRPRRTKGGVLI